MKTAEDLIEDLHSASSISARVAVDYMDGEQLEHLEDFLNLEGFGIKDWSARGVLPVFENITGHVIESSAKTYQQQPTRTVINSSGVEDEAATDTYNELINDSNATETIQYCDYLSRLLKTSVAFIQYDDDNKRLFFEAMSQDNCAIDYDRRGRKANSLLYSGGTSGDTKIYHHWTPTEAKTLEVPAGETARSLTYNFKTTATDTNPFNMIPLGVLYDTRAPRVGFWTGTVWDELIRLNIAVNMFQTEMKFNQRYGAIGSLFTNAAIKEGSVIGPDTVNELETDFPEQTPFVSYEAPTVQVGQFLQWLNAFRESVGRNWGVNIKMQGDASADSGFKLVVEELPTLELRKKRLPAAETFEKHIYESVLAISRVKNLGLPEGSKLKVEFPEPDLPVNKAEQWQIRQGEMAFGVLSKKDYLKEKNPSWTDEQVDFYLAEIQAEKNVVPSFQGLVDADTETD